MQGIGSGQNSGVLTRPQTAPTVQTGNAARSDGVLDLTQTGNGLKSELTSSNGENTQFIKVQSGGEDIFLSLENMGPEERQGLIDTLKSGVLVENTEYINSTFQVPPNFDGIEFNESTGSFDINMTGLQEGEGGNNRRSVHAGNNRSMEEIETFMGDYNLLDRQIPAEELNGIAGQMMEDMGVMSKSDYLALIDNQDGAGLEAAYDQLEVKVQERFGGNEGDLDRQLTRNFEESAMAVMSRDTRPNDSGSMTVNYDVMTVDNSTPSADTRNVDKSDTRYQYMADNPSAYIEPGGGIHIPGDATPNATFPGSNDAVPTLADAVKEDFALLRQEMQDSGIETPQQLADVINARYEGANFTEADAAQLMGFINNGTSTEGGVRELQTLLTRLGGEYESLSNQNGEVDGKYGYTTTNLVRLLSADIQSSTSVEGKTGQIGFQINRGETQETFSFRMSDKKEGEIGVKSHKPKGGGLHLNLFQGNGTSTKGWGSVACPKW